MPRRNTPRHIVIKLIKIKDKDKIVKEIKGKTTNSIQGKSHKVNSRFQQKLCKSEGTGTIFSK